MTGIAHLTTEGGAHACGLAHGRRFAHEIADNVATYLRRFAASGLERDEAFAEAARRRTAIAAHSPAYAEELPTAQSRAKTPLRCSTRATSSPSRCSAKRRSKGRKSCSNSASTVAPR